MNCLIVEDNPTAFTYLKQQLVKIDASACSNDTIVDSLSKLRQALANQSSYDIIFMDIKLLDGVCFDVLKEMPISCPIVFTTAFNELDNICVIQQRTFSCFTTHMTYKN